MPFPARPHLALILVALLASGACNRSSMEREMLLADVVTSFERVNFDTEQQVQRIVTDAAAAERAVMFIHIDWAPMKSQRERFAAFAIDSRQWHPDVRFYYVDCTAISDGYNLLRRLPGWQTLEGPKGGSLLHGNGEIVWMARGQVLSVEPIDDRSAAELGQRTEALMPTKSGPSG